MSSHDGDKKFGQCPKKMDFWHFTLHPYNPHFLGQKWAVAPPPRSLPSNMSNTKKLSFWCLVMMVTKKLEDVHKRLKSGQKNITFGPKKGHFGQSVTRNGPPSGQTATYRKTEGIQSYLRIWGTYDPIESGPSDPKKWGLYGCSVKKCRFSGQKCCFSAQNPFFFRHCPKLLLPS